MAESSFEKTEAPTPRRRQEARQEGNVAKSTDLTAACLLLAAVVLLNLFGLRLLGGLKTALKASLAEPIGNPTRPEGLNALGWLTSYSAVTALAPFALGLVAVALVVSVAQVGWVLSAKPLQPNLSKLSPLKGIRNLFNARAGMRLVMSLAKVGLIGAVGAVLIYVELPRILKIAELHVMPMLGVASSVVYLLAMKLAGVLLAIALLDYLFQRWQHEQDLKMTKQEVREEMKRMEGDPLLRQRRTRVARQLSMQRIAQAVPRAHVVVTNPTHYAVALRYDHQSMSAPKVIAKGADLLALRIRQIALANNVPLIERKELAQALYGSVEVGQEVPPQFYNAVAQILAYVYRLNARRSA